MNRALTASLLLCACARPPEPAPPPTAPVTVQVQAVAPDDTAIAEPLTASPAAEPDAPSPPPPAEDLEITDLALGQGPEAGPGKQVRVHYVGTLDDGTEFDSSRARGTPFTVELGKGYLIAGFERGLEGMRVGGVRRVRIPYRLGYGERGRPPTIPPRATLVFEIELLDVR